MSWINDRDYYEQFAKTIDPSIKLVTKDGLFWKIIGNILQVVTFNRFKKKTFLEKYATTIGPIQAYPKSYNKISKRLIIHEGEHTKCSRRLGFGINPWVGLPFMFILYVLIFPIGFSPFRYLFELEAVREEWKYMNKNGIPKNKIHECAKRFAIKLSSANYGWAMPKSFILKQFEKEVEKICK